MNWAKADNNLIKDLKDFMATFFQKNTLLNVILTYSVFDISNTLLIMRPYQIAATERILWKIRSAYNTKKWASQTDLDHIADKPAILDSFYAYAQGKQLEEIKALITDETLNEDAAKRYI